MFSARDVIHRYGGVLALNKVSLAVPKGSFSALVGANGAGKSTLGHILSGMLKPTSGSLAIEGIANATIRGGEGLAAEGICLIPEGRRLFTQLTVEENLLVGGFGIGCSRAETRRRTEEVMALMPRSISAALHRPAALLSGGERQMLALGRALMAKPIAVIVDEPSMGLAPKLANSVYDVLATLNKTGVTVLVIEQLAAHALDYSQFIFILRRGEIVYQGNTSDIAAKEILQRGYI